MPSGYQPPRLPAPGQAPPRGVNISRNVDNLSRRLSKVSFSEAGPNSSVADRRPDPPRAQRQWNTMHSGRGGGASSSRAPQHGSAARSETNMSKVSYSMKDCFKQRGVQIQGVITHATSTAVQHFKARDQRMKANTDPRDYELGDIILGPWVVSCLDAKVIKDKDPKKFASFTWAETTGPIIAKCRPMIVYAIFKDHLLVYPVGSSGGQGLFWKSNEVKNRSIPLYEGDYIVSPKQGDFYFRAEHGYSCKEGSYVDMTMPYNVSLGAPIVRLSCLTEHSFRRFIGLHNEFLRRGQRPIDTWTGTLPRIPPTDNHGKSLSSPALE